MIIEEIATALTHLMFYEELSASKCFFVLWDREGVHD